jgi:hypothetical protein
MMSRNPFTGTVSFQVTGDNHPATLTVYDAFGRVVDILDSSTLGSFSWTPTSDISPGVYIVRGSVIGCDLQTKVLLLEE